GLTTKDPPAATKSTLPSAGARATYDVPIVPPEPGRFSTIRFCLNVSDRRCAKMRANASLLPPAGKGTTNRTGLLGHADSDACACGRPKLAQSTPAAKARLNLRRACVNLLTIPPNNCDLISITLANWRSTFPYPCRRGSDSRGCTQETSVINAVQHRTAQT